MLSSLGGSCILAATYTFGIGLHQTIFRYGEWDLHSFKILVAFSIAPVFLGTFLQSFHLPPRGTTTWESLEYSSMLVFIAICGIFSSISVYRGWFHRLNKFPGPFLARFSTFYMTFANIAEARGFKTTQALHAKYGDIVRVGPRELSVANPEAFRAIHLSSSCRRGPWYNVTAPMISLQMERDVKRHGERRRAWDKAFDNQALGDYMTRVNAHTENFCAAIEDSVKNNTSINLTKWIHLYSFDIMGDLAFGSSFDMLQSGTFHYFFNLAHKTLELIAIFSRLVWLFPVVKAVPFLSNDYKSFHKWVVSHVRRRIAVPPPVRDIFSWILNDYQRKQKPSWQDTENLYGDASLIVIAGSDTVAGTLICLLYHLASSPDVCQKLRDELQSCAEERANTELRPDELSKLPYLQACIDETLRLWPAVVDGLQRETPPEGLKIGTEKKSTWIPGNVIIKTPSYTLCRDPRAFSRPDEFIPERWTTQPELILDASVYAPFSLGRFSCVGKRLAMMMMRRFISSIILRYELESPCKSAQDAFERQVKEYFTLTPPDLEIRFIKEQKR